MKIREEKRRRSWKKEKKTAFDGVRRVKIQKLHPMDVFDVASLFFFTPSPSLFYRNSTWPSNFKWNEQLHLWVQMLNRCSKKKKEKRKSGQERCEGERKYELEVREKELKNGVNWHTQCEECVCLCVCVKWVNVVARNKNKRWTVYFYIFLRSIVRVNSFYQEGKEYVYSKVYCGMVWRVSSGYAQLFTI